MLIKTKKVETTIFLLISIVALFLERVFLYFYNIEHFQTLTILETTLSFLNGIRIDLIAILTFSGIYILILLFLERFRRAFQILWFLTIVLIFTINFGDILYFPFVNRHISNELSFLGNDLTFLFDMAKNYIYEIIFYLISISIIAIIWFRVSAIPIAKKELSFGKEITFFILATSLIFIGVRGKIEGKPFGISDAFINGKVESANLSLNGFFSIYRSSKERDFKFMNSEKAIEITQNLLEKDFGKFKNREFPIERYFENSKNSGENIVIIFVESLTSKYVDSFGGENFGATPFLDKLSEKSLVFKNFYANGQRSIEGITAVLTGFPSISGLPNLGNGLELSNFSYLGKLANLNGYRTIGMQSSKRSSFRIDSLFKLAGFQEFYGAEDMADFRDFERDMPLPFDAVWDGNAFRFLSEKLKKEEKPFLSFIFTASTHFPCKLPHKDFEIYPHNEFEREGYLNNLKYVDSEIESFFKRSEGESWFQNTTFIITGDHTLGKGVGVSHENLEHFRVPLIIYSPKNELKKEFFQISSQTDILPTIIDKLGLNNKFSAFGNSLLRKRDDFAILREGNEMILLKSDDFQYLENSDELKAYLQTFSNLFQTNSISSIK